MDYFAGLDVSMEETHVCVVDREGAVIHEVKVPSTPADIKTALAEAPACRRVVFETGRMAPMLHHGLTGCGVPVICIESRQARQALKSFATHKTDRNDARGLAHLARTGFFKPVHVKSLPAHAIRSLIIAPQEAGRPARHAGEPDPGPRGGVWCPLASGAELCVHRESAPGKRGDRRLVSCHARPCRCTRCRALGYCGDRCRHEEVGQGLRCMSAVDDNSRRWPSHRAGLRGRRR